MIACDRRTAHDRNPTTRPSPTCASALAVGLLLVVLAEGCSLPVAVYRTAEDGSGLPVSFHDENAQQVHQDGLLVVRREYFMQIAWNLGDPPPSFELVEIHDGQTVLPCKTRLASLWFIAPGTYPWFIQNPIQTVLIYPFLPGYYNAADELDYDRFKCGQVHMTPSTKDEQSAIFAWEAALDEARGLSPDDYVRLQDFVRAEVDHLASQIASEGASPTSRPSL